MRWPFVKRSYHERMVKILKDQQDEAIVNMQETQQRYLEYLCDRWQLKVDEEYSRAREEGRRQVHGWAVAVNAGVFHGQGDFTTQQRAWVMTCLQDAERQFSPRRTILSPDTHGITAGGSN
jgi:hypothetical protein